MIDFTYPLLFRQFMDIESTVQSLAKLIRHVTKVVMMGKRGKKSPNCC
jgi:hypothetical protein